MGENHSEENNVTLYGINLLLRSITFLISENSAKKNEGADSIFSKSIATQKKEYRSLFILSGVIISFFNQLLPS